MNQIDLAPRLKRNDTKARIVIFAVSLVVFTAVVILSKVKLEVDLPFNIHIFALINAVINTLVAVMLLVGLQAIRNKDFKRHKNAMMTAIILSVLFLLSYIAHHLLAGDTRYGDLDHNGILSEDEIAAAGPLRKVYYILLLTHIPLAGIILPFILFTAYRSLCGDYEQHKKLARITWPVWFYVAVTGVLVYYMIRPYYEF